MNIRKNIDYSAMFAALDAALTADLGVLDRRLQGHQRAFSEDNLFMPAGIFAALYAATEESLAVSTSFPVVNPPPTGFHLPAGLPRLLLWCVLAAWLLLRTVCGRSGSGLARVLAVENGAVFSLVLLSAWQGFDRRELFTGIPSGKVYFPHACPDNNHTPTNTTKYFIFTSQYIIL